MEVDAIKYFDFLSVTGTDPVGQYGIKSSPKERSEPDWGQATSIKVSDGFPIDVTVSGIQPGLSQVESLNDHDHREKLKNRRRFKIAYLILVHKSKESVLAMLKYLHSPDSIILIHVDGNYPELQNDIRRHIIDHYKDCENIYLFQKPFNLQW